MTIHLSDKESKRYTSFELSKMIFEAGFDQKTRQRLSVLVAGIFVVKKAKTIKGERTEVIVYTNDPTGHSKKIQFFRAYDLLWDLCIEHQNVFFKKYADAARFALFVVQGNIKKAEDFFLKNSKIFK